MIVGVCDDHFGESPFTVPVTDLLKVLADQPHSDDESQRNRAKNDFGERPV